MAENQLVAVMFDGRNDNVLGVYRIQNGMPVSVIEDQHIPFENITAN